MSREGLIEHIKRLLSVISEKQAKYAQENNTTEVAYLTKEACELTALLPRMRSLGVTLDDCV